MRPKLAITMGDPAGIGAEVIIKAFNNTKFMNKYDCTVVGERSVLEYYGNLLGMDTANINVIDIPVVKDDFEVGIVSAKCGEAAFKYIECAINMAKAGTVDAVVTCPINKEALKMAGFDYPGHTEIFAEKLGIENFTMLFKVDNVSVVHCTTHCSLRDAIELITTEKVKKNIVLLNDALKSFGVITPRIAVAGLNPHAGENGLFGREEIEKINPAVEWARNNSIDASGAFPPDTVFAAAFKGKFDGVVSMLHDHGFVALKSRDFEKGVNITVGLPVVRTSVGHGTAFDIAGKNIASENSLLEAIDTANKMVMFRKEK